MAEAGEISKTGAGPVVLGAVALLLAMVTVVLSQSNRGLQREVAAGQQQLAKAQTMANLDNSLIQLLAKSAVDDGDAALRSLLERNGVQVQATPKASASPEATGDGK